MATRKPPKTSVPQRANKDSPTRWQKGGPSPNPGGRTSLPEWFHSAAPSALAMLVAAGTGRVIEIDGDSPAELLARKELARDAPPNIREAASNKIVEREYGKVKDQVEHSGEVDTVTHVELIITRTPPKAIPS